MDPKFSLVEYLNVLILNSFDRNFMTISMLMHYYEFRIEARAFDKSNRNIVNAIPVMTDACSEIFLCY